MISIFGQTMHKIHFYVKKFKISTIILKLENEVGFKLGVMTQTFLN